MHVRVKLFAGLRERAGTETLSLTEHFHSEETALAEPARGLRELAERLSAQWSR